MTMLFNVLKVNQAYSYNKDVDRLNLSCELAVDDDDDSYIEIGETCIICAPNGYRFKEKKQVELSVSIYDIATVEQTASSNTLERLRSTENRLIGIAVFQDELVVDGATYPPDVRFIVWLSGKAYAHLIEQVQNKNFPTAIYLHLRVAIGDKDTGLVSGWEPDGRHQIWKRSQTEYDVIDIEGVRIDYQSFQRTRLDIAVADVAQELDQEAKRGLLANASKPFRLPEIKNELDKIHRLLLIATVILGVIALKFW